MDAQRRKGPFPAEMVRKPPLEEGAPARAWEKGGTVWLLHHVALAKRELRAPEVPSLPRVELGATGHLHEVSAVEEKRPGFCIPGRSVHRVQAPSLLVHVLICWPVSAECPLRSSKSWEGEGSAPGERMPASPAGHPPFVIEVGDLDVQETSVRPQ